jgi:very-short-patch-repair endonuclease
MLEAQLFSRYVPSMRVARKHYNFARALRRRLTPSEVRLWVRLRQCRAFGATFRRQHPIGRYVADFYCAEARLVVEIDGGWHNDEDRMEHDAFRDLWLTSQGYSVLRFKTGEVMADADTVADKATAMAIDRIRARAGSAVEGPLHRLRRSPSPASQGRSSWG